jgi:hypothetical protein
MLRKYEDLVLVVQDDQKSHATLLKYLLMVAFQFNSIEKTNTQYHCDHAPEVFIFMFIIQGDRKVT